MAKAFESYYIKNGLKYPSYERYLAGGPPSPVSGVALSEKAALSAFTSMLSEYLLDLIPIPGSAPVKARIKGWIKGVTGKLEEKEIEILINDKGHIKFETGEFVDIVLKQELGFAVKSAFAGLVGAALGIGGVTVGAELIAASILGKVTTVLYANLRDTVISYFSDDLYEAKYLDKNGTQVFGAYYPWFVGGSLAPSVDAVRYLISRFDFIPIDNGGTIQVTGGPGGVSGTKSFTIYRNNMKRLLELTGTDIVGFLTAGDGKNLKAHAFASRLDPVPSEEGPDTNGYYIFRDGVAALDIPVTIHGEKKAITVNNIYDRDAGNVTDRILGNGTGKNLVIKASSGVVTSAVSTLSGSVGDDLIISGATGDTLIGHDGKDTFIGGGGGDTIIGGIDVDVFVGGAGNDTLTGLGGNDEFDINTGDGVDTITDAQAGDKIFYDGVELKGTAVNVSKGLYQLGETFLMQEGRNLYITRGGNTGVIVKDYFPLGYQGATSQTNIGITIPAISASGPKPYTPIVTNAPDIVGDELANNMWDRAGFSENIYGYGGVDIIHSYGGGDLIDGGAENDEIYGAKILIGGEGNDTLVASDRTVLLDGGIGNDELHPSSTSEFVMGGTGIDTVVYDMSASVQVDLRLVTQLGEMYDRYGRGTGNYAAGDVLSSIENVTGSGFGDTLIGDDRDNVIDGGGGYGGDTLIGGGGNDVLLGRAGNDTLEGGTGADRLDGGANVDTASYTGSSAAVNVNLARAMQSGGDAQGDVLIDIENITGSAFNDALAGNNLANRIDGGVGVDTVSYAGSSAGVDVNLILALTRGQTGGDAAGDRLFNIENIIGSGFADTLAGNSLINRIDGGAGLDTISYFSATAGVKVNLALTTAQADGDTLVNIENITGSYYADTLTARAAGSTLKGMQGNDILNGGTGNDTLDGGLNNDTLIGGKGNDTYIVGRNYQSDTIVENDATAGNTDILSFGAGVARDQIWLTHTGNDLVLRIIGTSDKMTIKDWYSGSSNQVEQIKTSTGNTLLNNKVQNLVNAMAGMAVPAYQTLSTTQHAQLDAVIAANWT